jgi:acetyl/propionyl-CoA carboxylase alpha subunit
MRQFKDEGVLIEQRISDFNHLEVQIVSDRTGKHHVHFGTRNCSIQSVGLQKRIEVAPGFDPSSRHYAFDAARVLADITEYSLSMARKVGYDSLGTWEWIVTKEGHPFLMEVNTRIQVENGISARIARVNGREVNLVAEQIRLALGDPMGYTQDNIAFDGVSIEYRIIAEDPYNRFTPWVGRIDEFGWPSYPWLQVHTHVPTDRPYEIPIEFDPNLALVIIWGKDLAQAREHGLLVLDSMRLCGKTSTGEDLKSNIQFHKANTERLLRF